MAAQEQTPSGLSDEKHHVPASESQCTPAPPPAQVTTPTVRFASATEEIEPDVSLDDVRSSRAKDPNVIALQQTLQGASLQNRRMSNYNFEPMSLPASRVPSHDDSSAESSRHNTYSGRPSPHQSPRVSSMHSPPITPAATLSRDTATDGLPKGAPLQKVAAERDPTAEGPSETPQVEGPAASPASTNLEDLSRPGSAGVSTRPTSRSEESTREQHRSENHRSKFSIGPSTHGGSGPASRETSPGGSVRHPTFSRPFTPAGDDNDPYAAHKRAPQSKNLDAIDARFKFSALGSKRPGGSTPNLPTSSKSTTNKRESKLFGGKEHLSAANDDSSTSLSSKPHGSMSELKRFLKIGHRSGTGSTKSPTPSIKQVPTSGTKTPPHHKTVQQLPFDDTHGLTTKYGKLGKVLGAGAGGSVRLMKRSDNKVFAVKEFRARHSYETEKEYAKKVTAEFCIGSTLHHGNIIETLDIIQEKGKWYEVMEYAPYDLFAIVMTGRMSKEEVNCAFLQIVSGVTFLHSSGLAHRDLKLDNVVVNEYGIMKIIDFGSATVFKYPFESKLVLAHGIVGSDPYLAPEVYDPGKYDPQPVDIWSLAIIFCCMSLRRFPWKMPRMTDNSYKLFASPPTPGTDMRRISADPNAKSTTDLDTPARDVVPEGASRTTTVDSTAEAAKDKKPEVLKGPWRLLRLLPRETRGLMSRMLEIDPKRRATMTDVIEDTWVSSSEPMVCRQEEGKYGVPGRVINAPNHEHVLVGPAPPGNDKK